MARGENDAGKMAILKAVAERHSVVGMEKLRGLASGEAPDEERLCVLSHLRGALCDIGLHCAIVPINVMETVETQAIFIANEDWNDLEFEVALDSGAVIMIAPATSSRSRRAADEVKHFLKATVGRSRTSARSRSTSATTRATTSGASSRLRPPPHP